MENNTKLLSKTKIYSFESLLGIMPGIINLLMFDIYLV